MIHQFNLVPFRRRSSSIHPVNSVKHIVDAEGQLAAATASGIPIAVTVDALTTPFKPGDIRIGGKINGFYISVFMIGSGAGGQQGSLNWILYKEHAGQAAVAPTPSAAGTSEIRNQIIHQEKGLAGSEDGSPMIFKGVIAVPRGMRRMREGDSWFIRLLNTDATNNVNFCVQSIYKSFF